MDKKARRRQIIQEKSVYKPNWSVMDEIQFQWILFMLKRNGILKKKKIRANVKKMLLKLGKSVEPISAEWEIF